jgi:hypothetical protein
MKQAFGAMAIVMAAGCGSADRVPDLTQAVVHIDNSQTGGYCTGGLIAPNLVLTARHCVASMTVQGAGCSGARFGRNVEPQHLRVVFTEPGSSELWLADRLDSHFAQARLILTPEFEDDSACGRDIAAIVLDHDVPLDVAEPFGIRPEPDAEPGGSVEMIGFGATQDGVIRTRTSSAGSISCVRSRCDVRLTNAEFMSDYFGCTGDSGAPVIDIERKLLGVHTAAFPPQGERCGGQALAVSVPYYADPFIQESLEIASSL